MKRLLLDTHVFLWCLSSPKKLLSVRTDISNPNNKIYVSAATAWEISIKRQLGKLKFPDDINQIIDEKGFLPLSINPFHGELAGNLPIFGGHKDPFDRMLIAQAQVEGLTIVTHDSKFVPYGVSILWVK